MLIARGETVTVCNSRHAGLPSFTRAADILIAAAGVRGLVTADMVKSGAIVIDVGINRLPNGKLAAMFDYDNVRGWQARSVPSPEGSGA